MAIKYLAFVIFIFIMVALVTAPGAQDAQVTNSTVMEPIQSSLSSQMVWSEEDWGYLVSPLHWNSFFTDVKDMVSLNLPGVNTIFTGNWKIVKDSITAPYQAILIIGLVLIFIGILQRTI